MHFSLKKLTTCFSLAACLVTGEVRRADAVMPAAHDSVQKTALVDSFNVRAARILVDKSDHRMDLIDKQGKIIRSYPVALGQNPVGKKEEQGDQKTPEGEYRIDWRQESEKFYLGLHISYPNKSDRKDAAQRKVNPGSALFIHGGNIGPRSDGRHADWTDGCIAVTNKEIEEIWKLVPNGTPIVIQP